MGMMFVGGLLFAYSGMLALCQGLERHYKQVWGKPCAVWQRRVLRALGWVGLGVSFVLCVQAWGWAMGPVGWFGVMSLSGLVLVMLLPYVPRVAVWLGAAAGGWVLLLLGV
ncbi:MAG TPA: DUF3325 domain-containing protein [Pseudomonas sp.]|uniref:DUF3325 domain-containing protein n=1 Tax=Pseudomonas sp. TaxID=306 RepID=UPI002B46549E|nr:DUF3325 domain-containing protein [Pseudomonas sp.]HKS13121.1 DUF3325 domain-containing protein [Pseudomonas sp.]